MLHCCLPYVSVSRLMLVTGAFQLAPHNTPKVQDGMAYGGSWVLNGVSGRIAACSFLRESKTNMPIPTRFDALPGCPENKSFTIVSHSSQALDLLQYVRFDLVAVGNLVQRLKGRAQTDTSHAHRTSGHGLFLKVSSRPLGIICTLKGTTVV